MIKLFFAVALSTVALPSFGALRVQLTASPAGAQPLGTPITFTASATDSNPGNLDFQFSAAKDGATFALIQDFDISNQLEWAATSKEGTRTVKVVARNMSTLETQIATVQITVTTRVTGKLPVVNATSNPLVALYSAPGCRSGASMYVQFGTSASNTNKTGAVPCTPSQSMNFYIAGMLPSTTYTMSPVIQDASGSTVGPSSAFTTGQINASLPFPPSQILSAANRQSSYLQKVLLLDYVPEGLISTYYFPVATDLKGNIVWYYPDLGTASEQFSYFIRPVPKSNGHFLLIAEDPNTLNNGQILREIDLAGNVVKQTSAKHVSEQLIQQGKIGILDFDHDAIRLPNGHTLVLCLQEKLYPPGTQGSNGTVDIMGSAVVDLDQNLQLTWSWSAYDHLDINRRAILGEICIATTSTCNLQLAPVANDWLHTNSINYIPSDGNLVLSMRHQDWVIKINYANSTGSGNVIWRLGSGGDFAINSTDPSPWFSHQHDAEYELGGTSVLSLYDNGNTRFVANPGLVENSRGYVLNVDDTNMIATPTLLVDLGAYSDAVGSAQRLENGNYFFESGFINGPPNIVAQGAEYLPDGTPNFLQSNTGCVNYRAYRMNSLYLLDETQGDAAAFDSQTGPQ